LKRLSFELESVSAEQGMRVLKVVQEIEKEKAEDHKPADGLPAKEKPRFLQEIEAGPVAGKVASAIKKEADKLLAESKGAVPPAEGNAKPKPAVKVNKYGIPADLLSKDKRLYNRVWKRCKSRGINYEEALKLEKTEKKPAPVKKKVSVKKKPATKKARLPYRMKASRQRRVKHDRKQ